MAGWSGPAAIGTVGHGRPSRRRTRNGPDPARASIVLAARAMVDNADRLGSGGRAPVFIAGDRREDEAGRSDPVLSAPSMQQLAHIVRVDVWHRPSPWAKIGQKVRVYVATAWRRQRHLRRGATGNEELHQVLHLAHLLSVAVETIRGETASGCGQLTGHVGGGRRRREVAVQRAP